MFYWRVSSNSDKSRGSQGHSSNKCLNGGGTLARPLWVTVLPATVSRQSVADTDSGALDVADSRWLYRRESQHVHCVPGTFVVQA